MATEGHGHLDGLTGQINLIYESTYAMERSVKELISSSKQIQKIAAAGSDQVQHKQQLLQSTLRKLQTIFKR
ncbi:hypothetical protein [Paenibacillus graminis]|uniref:hypothetical protein n=1 Tax=Paenibacillus graminis TaxID=189425 RepID=UPI002DB7B2FB|nr:hypothetical protein [Paenibacillus graminis]MEC0171066.1 hypothetical protein [Paenibacillus graminis]